MNKNLKKQEKKKITEKLIDKLNKKEKIK